MLSSISLSPSQSYTQTQTRTFIKAEGKAIRCLVFDGSHGVYCQTCHSQMNCFLFARVWRWAQIEKQKEKIIIKKKNDKKTLCNSSRYGTSNERIYFAFFFWYFFFSEILILLTHRLSFCLSVLLLFYSLTDFLYSRNSYSSFRFHISFAWARLLFFFFCLHFVFLRSFFFLFFHLTFAPNLYLRVSVTFIEFFVFIFPTFISFLLTFFFPLTWFFKFPYSFSPAENQLLFWSCKID